MDLWWIFFGWSAVKERDEMTEQALESNINDSMYFKIDEDDPNVSDWINRSYLIGNIQ